MVNIFYVNLRVKSDSYRQHLTPPFVFFGDNPNLFSPTSQFFSMDFSSSTGQCTCVHRPVYMCSLPSVRTYTAQWTTTIARKAIGKFKEKN